MSTWMISVLFYPKWGKDRPVFPNFGKKTQMDPGCAEDSEVCLQTQPCVHLMKESQQENAEGLSQAPLRDMPVHPQSAKIHPKPVGDI